MIPFLFFILFLVLENLFLPALIGPRPFLITPIFILALLIYRKNIKLWSFQAIVFSFVSSFFVGTDIQKIIIPLGLTAAFYLLLIKFLNFNEEMKNDITPSAFFWSVALLTMLSVFYSGIAILIDNYHNMAAGWEAFKTFLAGSIMTVAGWSLMLSIAFKFIPISR